jgi:hypothetical protein
VDGQESRARRNWGKLAQVGDDDPALLATNNAFIGQLPKQPTEVFGRNPNEPGEVAKP